MIAFFLFLSRCLQSYVVFIHVIIYYVMFLTNKRILNLESCYSNSTDSGGTMLESMVSRSNFGILNWDSLTRLPGNANPSSPDVSLTPASLITSTNWQTKMELGSYHLPILISFQMDVTINPIQDRSSIHL